MADERIAEEYRGVRFRQLAPKVRWHVGEGIKHPRESERPRNDKGRFLDPEGTFITFEDDAHLDLARMLRTGGLVVDDPNPKREAKAEKAAAAMIASAPNPAEGGGPTG